MCIRDRLLKEFNEGLVKVYLCKVLPMQTLKKLWQNLEMHSGEKSSKCNQCDFASSQASDLRRRLKTHSGGCRQFKEAFENTQWRKVKHMQPVLLCIISCRQFKCLGCTNYWRKVCRRPSSTLSLSQWPELVFKHNNLSPKSWWGSGWRESKKSNREEKEKFESNFSHFERRKRNMISLSPVSRREREI